ncbi:MAG: adenylate kinase [Candidatus Baltobacteraceae bacterium]
MIFLGPPGAGKGTQAQILEREHGVHAISTGDLLRRNRAEGTALGRAAEGYMDRGELVPDALILAMMEPVVRAAPAGVLLDGFPRTVAQAEALDALLAQCERRAVAILFEIDLGLLEARLVGRWTNPRTGRVYHDVFAPPRVAGIDDDDGGPLIQREDDEPETIRKRLRVYREATAPLVTYYDRAGRLQRLDATANVESVTHTIEGLVGPESNAA